MKIAATALKTRGGAAEQFRFLTNLVLKMNVHDSTPNPAANLAAVNEQLDAALREANRLPHSVHITAVAKRHGVDRILPVLDAGHRIFGENRVQEAAQKWPPLREKYNNIELHLVGPLQSNKAADAVALFEVIETVDRPKIARALAKEISAQGRTPSLLIQVNTGEEPQKAGIAPTETDQFLAFCQDECGLKIDGLMCIPPADEAPAPHFALLAKIAERHGLKVLSMGMSGDYPIAAQLGATHVRIGTGIFGERPPPS